MSAGLKKDTYPNKKACFPALFCLKKYYCQVVLYLCLCPDLLPCMDLAMWTLKFPCRDFSTFWSPSSNPLWMGEGKAKMFSIPGSKRGTINDNPVHPSATRNKYLPHMWMQIPWRTIQICNKSIPGWINAIPEGSGTRPWDLKDEWPFPRWLRYPQHVRLLH